jgi:hypothetical protein
MNYTVIAHGLDGQKWSVYVNAANPNEAKIKAWEKWAGRTTVIKFTIK